MTEPEVASSDATNIESSIARDGDHYVINGRKWWTSGAGDPRCKIFIFMGKTDPDERRPAQAAVDDPGAARHAGRHGRAHAAPCSATTTRRTATARSLFENVRVPASNLLLGEGRGFEIAQGRLGPGPHPPLHAPDRPGRARARGDVPARQRARRLRQAARRADDITLERIAESRIEIDQARLLVLNAAYMMDTVGNKAARAGDRR